MGLDESRRTGWLSHVGLHHALSHKVRHSVLDGESDSDTASSDKAGTAVLFIFSARNPLKILVFGFLKTESNRHWILKNGKLGFRKVTDGYRGRGSRANSKSAVWQFCVQHTKREMVKAENWIENRGFSKTEPKSYSENRTQLLYIKSSFHHLLLPHPVLDSGKLKKFEHHLDCPAHGFQLGPAQHGK